MKASFVVNSEGRVFSGENLSCTIRIRSINNRIADLDAFVSGFLACLHRRGLSLTKDSIGYKLQPLYVEDRIILFTKKYLEPNDPLVRKSYSYKTNPQWVLDIKNGEDSERTKDILNSIYFVQEREKASWYLLEAREIVMERNIYDCEWENIFIVKPIPYTAYMKQWYNNLISPTEMKSGSLNYGYYYPTQPDYTNPDNALKYAFRLDGNIQEAEKAINYALTDQCNSIEFAKKKPYSNQAYFCLYAINDLKYSNPIFGVYQTIKDIIKQELPTAFKIFYDKKNVISFIYNGITHKIYVCDPLESSSFHTFVLNGSIFNDTVSLQKGLKAAVEPRNWFNRTVTPYIK